MVTERHISREMKIWETKTIITENLDSIENVTTVKKGPQGGWLLVGE